MTDRKLFRNEATDSGIHMQEAVHGFTGGDPALLKGLSADEIEQAWNDAGESLPWYSTDIVDYINAGDYSTD